MIAGLAVSGRSGPRRAATPRVRHCGWASQTRGSATPRSGCSRRTDRSATADYYVRIDNNGDPNDGSEREYGNGAGVHKENSVLDAGFLDLVRLGVKAPNDPYVADSIAETDASLAKDTPSGRVWHRYTFDGYGEQADGSAWEFDTPSTSAAPGRCSAGERGEYEVANGRNALSFLQTMANTANDGYMIPEQVWDKRRPAPAPFRLPAGQGDRFGGAPGLGDGAVRQTLPRAIDAGRPVETPAVVRERYAHRGAAKRADAPCSRRRRTGQ